MTSVDRLLRWWPPPSGKPSGGSSRMVERDVAGRRRALLDDVTRLAWDLGRAVREAEALHLPVEPGVRDGREAVARWTVLLGQVIPPPR